MVPTAGTIAAKVEKYHAACGELKGMMTRANTRALGFKRVVTNTCRTEMTARAS